MNNQLIIDKVLHDTFPDEYSTLGNETIAKLIEGKIKFEPPEKGRLMPITEIFQNLMEGIAFINTVLEVYDYLEKKLEKEPTETDTEKEINSRGVLPCKLDQNKSKKVIQSVVNQRKQRKQRKRK